MTGENSRAPGVRETPVSSHRFADTDATGTQTRWQCPYCAHCLEYAPRDREAAELAANSHVNRQHKAAKSVVIQPEPSEATGP